MEHFLKYLFYSILYDLAVDDLFAAYCRRTTRQLFRAKKLPENAFYHSDAVRLSASCKLSVTHHAYSCR